MFQLLSPNMLKTFELCPKKFYLKYVKNISMPINDEIFELGKNIHALASYYLRNENIYKMEQSLNQSESILWEYLKKLSYFGFECINTEYQLSVKIGKNYFGGRLDALVKENNKYYILDYKTGSAPKNARFDFQTMIYLLSVRALYNTDEISFIYIDLKNKSEVKVDLTQDLVKEYEIRLLDIANKINHSEFTTQKKECKCEYKIICY